MPPQARQPFRPVAWRLRRAIIATGLGAVVLLAGASGETTLARLADSQQATGPQQLITGALNLEVGAFTGGSIYGVQTHPASAQRSIPQATCQVLPAPREADSFPDLSGLTKPGTRVQDVCSLPDSATALTLSGGDLVTLTYELTLTAEGKNMTGHLVLAPEDSQLPAPYQILGARLVAQGQDGGQAAIAGSDGIVRLPFGPGEGAPRTFTLTVLTRVAGSAASAEELAHLTQQTWVPRFRVYAEQDSR